MNKIKSFKDWNLSESIVEKLNEGNYGALPGLIYVNVDTKEQLEWII